MSTLRICLFGGWRVYRGEELIAFPSQKAQSLFAYLVTHRDRGHPREVLAGLFWGDLPEQRARANLRNALYLLREALEPQQVGPCIYFICQGREVRFNRESDYWLDVEEFEKLIAQAKRLEKEERAHCLEQAMALYRGDFMAGFYDDWVIYEQERLRALYLKALHKLLAYRRDRQEYDRAIRYGQKILQINPLQEETHRELMYLHWLCGERNAALQQYERCREILAKELGVEPLPETQALYQELQSRMQREQERWADPRRWAAFLLRHYAELGSPFVGRQEELAKLLAAWELAKEGKGQVIFIEGEVGIGKTRLAQKLLAHVLAQGSPVLQGRCYQMERLPYQPLNEALRSYVAQADPEKLRKVSAIWLSEIVKLIPELSERLPEVRPNPALSPLEQERMRLFEGLSQFILGLAQEAPLLLFLDDLHWADQSTLQYLHYLARRIPEKPLLLVATYRAEEVEGGLRELIGQLSQQELLIKLDLDRLSKEEVAQLLQGMLKIAEERKNELMTQAFADEGNPFFVVETVKSLIAAGILHLDEQGHWELEGKRLDQHVPSTVREAVASRLRRVSKRAKQILDLAAVAGPSFQGELLEKACGQDQEAVLFSLDELLKAHLLCEDKVEQRPAYRFSHEMFREVVYSSLSAARKSSLHGRVGKTLEARPDKPEGEAVIAGKLAYHFYQAGMWRKALKYANKAGELSFKNYALPEALSFFQRALESAGKLEEEEKSPSKKRFAIHNFCAQIYDILGLREEEEQAITGMLSLAQQLNDKQRQAQALLQRAEFCRVTGRYPQAKEAAGRALKLLQRLGDRRGEAQALFQFGLVHDNLGEWDRALEYFYSAYRIFKEVKEVKGEARALTRIALIYSFLGEYAKALEYYERPYQIFRRIGDKLGEMDALSHMGIIYENLGQYEQALAHYERSYQLSRELGAKRQEGAALNNIGSTYWGLGELAKALEFFKRALALGEEDTALKCSCRAIALLSERGSIQNTQLCYWNHFKVLWANHQEREALLCLKKACEEVMQRADKIKDPEMKQSFLQNIRVNREIIAAWEKRVKA